MLPCTDGTPVSQLLSSMRSSSSGTRTGSAAFGGGDVERTSVATGVLVSMGGREGEGGGGGGGGAAAEGGGGVSSEEGEEIVVVEGTGGEGGVTCLPGLTSFMSTAPVELGLSAALVPSK